METKKKKDSIRDKVVAEWEKGNVCVATFDGIEIIPMTWFLEQPLDGMLYDMNRDEETILSFIEDRKWVNDYALTRMLRYYHDRCKELENKLFGQE